MSRLSDYINEVTELTNDIVFNDAAKWIEETTKLLEAAFKISNVSLVDINIAIGKKIKDEIDKAYFESVPIDEDRIKMVFDYLICDQLVTSRRKAADNFQWVDGSSIYLFVLRKEKMLKASYPNESELLILKRIRESLDRNERIKFSPICTDIYSNLEKGILIKFKEKVHNLDYLFSNPTQGLNSIPIEDEEELNAINTKKSNPHCDKRKKDDKSIKCTRCPEGCRNVANPGKKWCESCFQKSKNDKSNKKNLSNIECYNCHKFGHYANKCPDRKDKKSDETNSSAVDMSNIFAIVDKEDLILPRAGRIWNGGDFSDSESSL